MGVQSCQGIAHRIFNAGGFDEILVSVCRNGKTVGYSHSLGREFLVHFAE